MPSIADVLEAGQGMVPRSAKCSPATLTRSCHWLSCWHPCTALPHSLHGGARSSSRIWDGNLKAVPRVLHTRVPVSLQAPPSLPSGMP